MCGGNDADLGCDGVCFSKKTEDCFGVCGGRAKVDDCGICNGDNKDKGCDGVCFSRKQKDCKGICGGKTKVDDCGVCGGNNKDLGCDGVCFSSARVDCNGICGGPNQPDDCGARPAAGGPAALPPAGRASRPCRARRRLRRHQRGQGLRRRLLQQEGA